MSIRICVGGATGWTGKAITQAVIDSSEFELTGAVARRSAGTEIGGVTIAADVRSALAAPTDVYVDYTHPSAVKGHVLTAIDAGVAVVIGSSGLGSADFDEIAAAAGAAGVGAIAAGNFSITAALLKHFAGIAARHVPHWEIVDMAHAGKPDAPSGTARELAEFLGGVAANEMAVPVDETLGERATRGATMGGAQVHSVRLPSYVIALEAIFGLPHERLTLRHDAGSGAEPYVGGTLLAARRVGGITGLVRGLDTLLFGE